MGYCWKVVMNNGKEYMVENEISNSISFINQIFKDGNEKTISLHKLEDGSNVYINGIYVSSIEFNFKKN